MEHRYFQHFSMAREGVWKLFKKNFREKPFYSILRIPVYFLDTLIVASIYHNLDMPTPEELEQSLKATRQRKSQVERAIVQIEEAKSKLGELDINPLGEY